MKKSILVICLIIALCLYFTTPKEYSLSNCYASFILFIISFTILFKTRCKNNIICFEFIFSISFFFTNYVYALFYYPINPYFSLFTFDFPEEYINRGTILSTIGYISYCYGALRFPQINEFKYTQLNHQFYIHKSYIPILYVALILLIFSLFPILLSGNYDGNWGDGAFYKAIADFLIFYILFVKLSKAKSFFSFISNNKLTIILIAVYLIEITMIGNRGLFLRLSLLCLFLYRTFYKKINILFILPILIIGMFFMYYIGSVRGEGTNTNLSDAEVPVFLEVGRDLTINSRSLYVLNEYTDKNGINFGQTWTMNFLSIFPFAQSIFQSLTGLKETDLNSASLVTDLHFRNSSDTKVIGLGTNLIGDIYLSFGLLGVLFFMFMLGKLISYFKYKGMMGDMRFLFLYLLCFMECIIFTRTTYFCLLRPISWCFFLYYYAKPRLKKLISHK